MTTINSLKDLPKILEKDGKIGGGGGGHAST